jgi:hypothetical protein
MAKYNIKTVKPKFVVASQKDAKIDVNINRPILEVKKSKAYFKLRNTGGPTGATGAKGDKGDTGEQGPVGPQGQAATVQVGYTNTVSPGSPARVTNSGTNLDAVLNFEIPQGIPGEQGAEGPAGPRGVPGQNGEDGFSPSASVQREDDGALIIITDKSGTTSSMVYDGGGGGGGDVKSYDATWAFTNQTATQAQIAELSAAIADNEQIYYDDNGMYINVESASDSEGIIKMTLGMTDVDSSQKVTVAGMTTTINKTTGAISSYYATMSEQELEAAIAAKADYGFYGVISGTNTSPTDVTTLANGVYKADDTKANSYVSLPMEDGTTKRQTLPRGSIAIKTVSRFIVLGTQNLMYQYDSSNQYYYQPDPFIEATIRREAQEGDVSLGQVGSPNVYLVTDPVVSLSATLTTADNQHTRITFTTDSTAEPEDFYLDIDHLDGDPILWQDGKAPTLLPGETWIFEVTGHTIEPLRFSDTAIVDAISYNDLSDKPQITYTSSTIESRNVTHTTVTEPVQGTKPISSYGPFNYIPLDMSSYTSGAANKALLPEKHLPSGAYVVTVAGYMRLGSETKQLQPGHIVFWDTESGELDLLGYNACEYWGYDSQNGTWDGGYFTTASDVEYMIEEKMPNWTKISSGAFIVANKDPGYYTFAYSSASGTNRRITINVEGTNAHYFPYNDTVLIKAETGVMMLGRYNLWFEYDGTNGYYKQPVPIAQAFTGTDGVNAGAAGLVPAPATTDAGKFLKSDGTWAEAGAPLPDNLVYSTDGAAGTLTPWIQSTDITSGAVTADKIDYATLVLSGTWTTTSTIAAVGNSLTTTVDVSSLGFSSADDYIVILTNNGGGANYWATAETVTQKTATGFTITLWNAQWANGVIGSGHKTHWAVFRVN